MGHPVDVIDRNLVEKEFFGLKLQMYVVDRNLIEKELLARKIQIDVIDHNLIEVGIFAGILGAKIQILSFHF